jgi:hypothetical protein
MTTGYSFSSKPGYPTPWGSSYSNTLETQWNGTNRAASPVTTPKQYKEIVIPERRSWNFERRAWDIVVPELRFKKRLHPSAKPKRSEREQPNPYFKEVVSIVPDYYGYTDDGGLSSYNGDMFNNVPNTSYWTADHTYTLYGKLQDRIAGSDFHAGVFLGEGVKTFDLLTDTARRVAQSLKVLSAAKRGNVVGAWRILTDGTKRHGRPVPPAAKRSSNKWLELQYGWGPLFNDAHEGAQFLGYLTSAPLERRVSVSYAISRDMDVQYQNHGATTLRVIRHLRESKKLTAYVKSLDALQLSGLYDPASISWELLPFSFVADWWLPIGNYLQNLNLAKSLQATYIITHKRETFCGGSDAYMTGGFSFSHRPRYAAKTFTITRSIHNSLPVPLPSVNKGLEALSWRRAVSSIALLVQRFGS